MNIATDIIDTADPQVLRDRIRDLQEERDTLSATMARANSLIRLLGGDTSDIADDLRDWAGDDSDRALMLLNLLDFNVQRDYLIDMSCVVYLTVRVTASDEDSAREQVYGIETDAISIDEWPGDVRIVHWNMDSADIERVDADPE